jgi:MFS family permease
MAIWQASLHTYGEMLATQVISGLSGAVSETLVQMTVADVFFVHQRGTMNGIYLLMVSTGTFLAPVASGYIANAQGWRWLYWWCTIFLGISTVLFLFFYEETKYIPSDAEARGHVTQHAADDDNDKTVSAARNASIQSIDIQRIDYSIPMRPWRQRLAFTTITKGSFQTIFCHTYQPFWILFTFPAAAYTALQYGSILAWFSVLATTEATYFTLPPYK